MNETALFSSFFSLLLALLPLLLLQRALHRQVQVIFLLLTRRPELALVLFSLLFFPGVLLHEASHYLAARLLGVRTGRFSVFPRPLPDGRLQLGAVETASADPLRETLIGAAPLLAGGAFVAFAGVNRLALPVLWAQVQAGAGGDFFTLLGLLVSRPDFWLWFYLLFTVSSTMLPSASDRKAWLPLGLFAGLLLAASLLAGAGPWLTAHLAPPLARLFSTAALIFFISDFVHLALLLPAVALHALLSRLTGLQVQ
jgi:hypothetical protein